MATLKEQIADLRRELDMKERFYPSWIEQRKKGYTKEVCAHRIDCTKSTIAILEKLQAQNTGEQTTLL